MTPLRLIEPSSVLRVDPDAVRVLVYGPVPPEFYEQVRDGVEKSRALKRPLHLHIDGGEGLDIMELDAALSYFRLILSRGEIVPLVIRVVEGSYAINLLSQLQTHHLLELDKADIG